MAGTMHRIRPHRRSSWLALVLAVALAGVACGGGGGASGGTSATTTNPTTSPTTSPTRGAAAPLTSAQHAEQLAKGESAAVAAELVEVPGYYYQDVDEQELKVESDLYSALDPLGVSFHGVRQLSTGDEIAFLQLVALDPRDAVHAPANEELFAKSFTGASQVRRFEFSGQTVFLAEEPSRPASRYQFVWLRHGTGAWVDGPDRAPIEDWLKAYLAAQVVLPGENPALLDRLVVVPGFAYTNETRPNYVGPLSGPAFAGAGCSIHYVFDESHQFGVIVLIGPAPSLTEQAFVARIAASLAEVNGQRQVPGVGLEMQGMTIHRLSSNGGGVTVTTFVWWWADAGMGGALVTTRPDIGEPFLKAFLAAQPSP